MSRLARRQPKVRARHLCAADAALLARETCTVQPRAPARASLSGVRSRCATQMTPDPLSLVPDAWARPSAPWRRLPDASRASRTVGPAWANSAAAALSPRLGPASCLCWCGARARGRRARAFHTAASVEVERAWRTPHAIAAIAKPNLNPSLDVEPLGDVALLLVQRLLLGLDEVVLRHLHATFSQRQ